MDLVPAITGLSRKGLDLAPYLHKDREKLDKNNMMTKYQLVCDEKRFLLSSIDDSVVRVAEKILLSKVLRNMRPTECTTTIVELEKKCVQGVNINWSQFLLNELMENTHDMKEHPMMKFHLSWLLILI